jgi:hypothetical protein
MVDSCTHQQSRTARDYRIVGAVSRGIRARWLIFLSRRNVRVQKEVRESWDYVRIIFDSGAIQHWRAVIGVCNDKYDKYNEHDDMNI